MKTYQYTVMFVFSLLAISCFSQGPMKMNLQDLYKKNEIEVYNRDLTLINEKSYPGIHLSKDYGEGIAWLKDVDFSTGVLEFDVRGEDVKQHSFVGIAFHAQNDSTFEAIYLRPFQFKSDDETLRSHSIQYISLPKFTWQVLRGNFPGKYEQAIDPSPDPNSWVRVRMEITDAMISTYINGEKEPSLVVEKFTPFTHGSVGFYVADTSGGDFANITITKTE
ncbi:MAG: hypothetical protein IPP15_22920 [Saprospiraceae bacterium]|uniref:3-keto-disaccharide hydrolase domain-containing protein n=1 Tax=Candidatus Opimibacter skivensis TaxID=2982028 RepID=A0A9D7T2K4_9BACT|nr:hypothetical protein [Candidatus Opimibacter skivensis]MBK9985174.1 hypothetical protein [Candidatus Opimibacter skivensis]